MSQAPAMRDWIAMTLTHRNKHGATTLSSEEMDAARVLLKKIDK